jgi:pyridoxine 5-phosphate synthase
MAISLSVNLNKVALLRNSRGAANPAPLRAGAACLDNGAYGLTMHWRGDSRHTRADDVRALRALCERRGAEFNLEGDDREELIALAIELAVTQFTLVPVKPGEITSDHGWDLPRQHPAVAPVIARCRSHRDLHRAVRVGVGHAEAHHRARSREAHRGGGDRGGHAGQRGA